MPCRFLILTGVSLLSTGIVSGSPQPKYLEDMYGAGLDFREHEKEVELGSPTAKYGHEAKAQGAMKLDHLTLPKAIDAVKDTPKNVLVTVFSRPNTENPEWNSLVDALYNVSNLLFSEAWVDHSDDSPHGTHMEKAFRLDSDKFPQYFIYCQGYPQGLAYHGMEKYEDIATWIDVNSNLELPHHDTLKDFEKLVRRFVHSADKREVVQTATVAASESGDAKARHYVSIMQKVVEKGDQFIPKEIGRLSDMLMQLLPDNTRSDLSNKLKVLKSFERAMSGGTAAHEDDEEHL